MTDTRLAREGGDRDEVRRAQRGDRPAFQQLYERHAPLTWRLALVAGRDQAVAEAAVVGAFAHVLGRSDRHDTHRFAPVGAQLLRSARESAVEKAGRTAEPAGLEAIGEIGHMDSVRAFDLLPERWRSVLWLDQVERCNLSTTAQVLDTSEQSTAGLATRALGGFREQLVQLTVHPDLRPDCRQATLRLSGYVAHALPSRDTIRVRRHLDRCEECRTRLDELDDVTQHLRGAMPALPYAIESLAMGAWLARTHEGSGPIGMRLPGGAMAPAWVERGLAGAAAAVVSIGITAAVALNARGGGNPVAPTESATARSDGEQAFGGEDSTGHEDAEGSATVVSLPPTSSSNDPSGPTDSSSDGTSTAADPVLPSSPPSAMPRGGESPTPSGPTSPTPTSPTPPPSDPSDPPSSSDPVGDVVGVVEDVVDGVCDGLEPVCGALPTSTPLPPIPGL